jgi:hypothetical protein
LGTRGKGKAAKVHCQGTSMKRRIAILVVGVVVSVFGAGACAGEDEVRQRAQDEVDQRRQQAEDRVQEERTRLEQEGRTLIEEQQR